MTVDTEPRPAVRSAVARWLVAGAIGGATVAAIEWAILVVSARDQFASPVHVATVLPLAIGNAIPYGLVTAALLLAVDGARGLAARRVRWPLLVVTAVVALVAAPYGAWVADEAFSGPRARTIPLRDVWVGVGAAAIALSFAAAAWLAAWRREARRHALAAGLALVAIAAAILWLGRTAYRNEYETLHDLLAMWAFVTATLAGRELGEPVARRSARRLPVLATAAALVATVSVGASIALARSHAAAWLVWRETGASRYLTHRWMFLAPRPRLDPDAPTMNVRPSLASPGAAAARAERARRRAPDVVILTIDGLRIDHVGAYGHPRPTTPNFDRLAARGVRFTNAVSGYPATQVFNTSLLLGRAVPLQKRDQQPEGFRGEALPRLLDRRGYHVFVKSWFEHSSQNSFDAAAHAIDTYAPKSGDRDELEAPMEETLARLDTHLAEADRRAAPVLLWLHLLGTHPVTGGNFEPHPDHPFGESRMDRYDSAIAGSDAWIPEIEARLAARRGGAERATIWVLGSDHGTNTDRASRDLGDGVVRVPLAIVAPGVAPRTEDALVDAAIDVAATVVDLVGIAPPPTYDGVSLVPLLLGEDGAPFRDRVVPLRYGALSGAIYRSWKTIRDDESLLLVDRATDPAERRNLADERRELADAMTLAAEAELSRRRSEASRARVAR